MKAYIWHSEYEYSIAVANSEEEARELMEEEWKKKISSSSFSFDIEHHQGVFSELSYHPDVEVPLGKCMIIDHSNE